MRVTLWSRRHRLRPPWTTQARDADLARPLGTSIASGTQDVQIDRLIDEARLPIPAWFGIRYADELRAAYREFGPEASSGR